MIKVVTNYSIICRSVILVLQSFGCYNHVHFQDPLDGY